MARLTLNGMYQYDPDLFELVILPDDYNKESMIAEILQRSGQLYPYHQVPHMFKDLMRRWFARNYFNFEKMMEALTAEYSPIENYNRVEAWTRTPDLTDKSTLSGSDSSQLSGSDSSQLSGDDVVKHTGTDTTDHDYDHLKETTTYKGSDSIEKEVSAFDASTYQPAERETTTRSSREDEKDTDGLLQDKLTHGHIETTTNGRKDTMTYGKKDTMTYGKVDTETHTGTESFRSNIHGNIGVTTSQQMIEAELELRKFDLYTYIAALFEREFIVQVY